MSTEPVMADVPLSAVARPLSSANQSRPTLTVSIITRNSESRLAEAVAQARRFANEVVVGVDADSEDDTWGVATSVADTVYHYRHPGQLAPVHLLALQHCHGDWILRLDDDEYMESGFDSLLPELLSTQVYTHYYLARKLVVSLDPPEYLHAAQWYPNFGLRLFRNDLSILWKPPRHHTGIKVAGMGLHEPRAAILHYEPIYCSPAERERKLAMYRTGGQNARGDLYYHNRVGEQRPFQPLPPRPTFKPEAQRIDASIKQLTVQPLPAWGADIKVVEIPREIPLGQKVIVSFSLTNTGSMSWIPSQPGWGTINLGFHLKTLDGKMLDRNGGRIKISAAVRPSQTVTVIGLITFIAAPGRYLLEWDLFNESECWFEQCGSKPVATPVLVVSTVPDASVVKRFSEWLNKVLIRKLKSAVRKRLRIDQQYTLFPP